MAMRTFTATIYREDDGYVALCPEMDVASQGDTPEQAHANLREAVELFLEAADPAEVAERLHAEIHVSPLEVEVGEAPNALRAAGDDHTRGTGLRARAAAVG